MKKYHRAVFFTKVPLTGFYRYKDIFQIFPCNMENMPKSKMQRHFPNILEFTSTGNEKFTTPKELVNLKDLHYNTAVTITIQDRIYTLLTTFTNNLFFRYEDITGFWGIPFLKDNPTDEEANSWSSKWCMSMYHFPDLPRQFKIDSFTKLEFDTIEKIPYKQFYMNDPNLDFDRTKNIIFPDSIDLLFDRFFSLEKSISKIIETATSYNYSAIELKDSRKTLSLLSSFTALETMVNLEYKDFKPERCSNCGQPKFKVSKKFKDFLSKYIGKSTKNKKKFNDFYSLRSKIVHTGQQLKTEHLFSDIPEIEKDEERITRIEIIQLGKLAVTNWLLHNIK